MPISTAVQRGNAVYVYNEKNNQIACKSGVLHGYTGSTFSIKVRNVIYTYNERGQQLSAKSG